MSAEHSQSLKPKNAIAARWSLVRRRFLTNTVLAICGAFAIVSLSAVALFVYRTESQIRRSRSGQPIAAVRVSEEREALRRLEHKPRKNLDRMF
jgi:hypothetical protein